MDRISLAIENFLLLVSNYNSAIFPGQIVFFIFGCIAVYYLFWHKPKNKHLIGGLLTFLWIWMVIVYNIMNLAQEHAGTVLFGILFTAQGIFFFLETFQDKNLLFKLKNDLKSYIAVFFILYGLVIYPVLGYSLHGTVSMILNLGMATPTIILTFGFLMLSKKGLSRYLLIIPTICAIIIALSALYSGLYQDLFLVISAAAAIVFILPQRRFNEANTISYNKSVHIIE